MAAPTIEELFGLGAFVDVNSGALTIPELALDGQGLPSIFNATPVQVLAAIVKRSSDSLIANTDDTINAESTTSVLAPATRNGIDRILFSFILEFYLPYSVPNFLPLSV